MIERKTIFKSAEKLQRALENLPVSGIKRSYSFIINCESMGDFNNIDIRDSVEYKDIFKELAIMESPVLYWFEIISNTDNTTIRTKLQEYTKQQGVKSAPALKKSFDVTSRCLYVGKVKKQVWGRMIQHMGYYKVRGTQGLQLYHWSKGLNLTLKVHLTELSPDFSELISIFEKELAKELKPITGKH